MSVRTRFAPSPTGYLHIGGVRTALFNWLFARKHGGQYILRIDDTDQQRNVEAALAPILHGFRWLGIEWDEGPEVGGPHAPYFQSQRSAPLSGAPSTAGRVGARLPRLRAGRGDGRRAQGGRGGEAAVRLHAALEGRERRRRARFEAEGRKGSCGSKMPREGKLVLHDLVRGDVEFEWAQEADHVIQRADGSFIYHLANVVDDRDFEITHVIRAEEHLSNTPRQVFMVQALGYPLPAYAHLPFVAEPGSKRKLSQAQARRST